MQTARTTRTTSRPLLAAWLLVCALVLQPLAGALSGPTCDASGDCCCTSETAAEPATHSSCCSAPKTPEHHTKPTLQSSECGCRMESGGPASPLTPVAPPAWVDELGHHDASHSLPLPVSLVGALAVSSEVAFSRDDGGPPGECSLLVRRLQAGGLNAHLARLATLRL